MSKHPLALALDFGRVLTLDPDKTPFAELWKRAGIDAERFQEAYSARRSDYDRGTVDAGEYWAEILVECSPDIDADLAAELIPAFIDADFFSWARPRVTLHRLVKMALDTGVPVAIVSNMPEGVGERFVRSWPWLERIPHRFFSAAFGHVKPDAEFYRHVLKNTGWDPARVLFVDDIPENIAGAAAARFKTLLFTGSDADLRTIGEWCGLPLDMVAAGGS
jgi:putative hydrolase of the HAD superfamily